MHWRLRNPGPRHCRSLGKITGHYFQAKVPERRKVTFPWAWALVLLQWLFLMLDYCLWITSTFPAFSSMSMKCRWWSRTWWFKMKHTLKGTLRTHYIARLGVDKKTNKSVIEEKRQNSVSSLSLTVCECVCVCVWACRHLLHSAVMAPSGTQAQLLISRPSLQHW